MIHDWSKVLVLFYSISALMDCLLSNQMTNWWELIIVKEQSFECNVFNDVAVSLIHIITYSFLQPPIITYAFLHSPIRCFFLFRLSYLCVTMFKIDKIVHIKCNTTQELGDKPTFTFCHFYQSVNKANV